MRARYRFAQAQRITGLLLMMLSLSLLPPLAVSLVADDGAARAFLEGLWMTFTAGAAMWWPVRREVAELKIRDGYIIVVSFWTVLSVFGAIPLYVTDSAWFSYTDALFETMSGLTTTGATVVAAGLDRLPPSLNFYRCQLQWLGGGGFIVLAVALLPMFGIGGMQLLRAETPGPMKDNKLTPRITETARALWAIYVALTAACALVYWELGMSAFDAVCHAFTTIATGGFSTHDASFGHWNSPALEWAACVFMFLGAVNFSVHFLAWRERGPGPYLRDAEVRLYAGLVVLFTACVMAPLVLAHTLPDAAVALRKALFHVVSYGTTTGFVAGDPSGWPSYAPLLLIVTSFMMGCAGSTAGGVKVVRLLLFVKQAMRELQRLTHPSAALALKLGGRPIPDHIVYAVGGFFSVYIGATLVLTFVTMATGLDALTAFSAVAACINNLGPGLGPVAASMAGVSDAGKWVLIFAMLLGRLEIFTLLIVLTPGFWRR
jgi:trk system potassium uptake protein